MTHGEMNGEMTPDGRLAEYVLGTLEPLETAEVEELLAESAEARAELRSLSASLVRLTEGLAPVEPPAHVWEGLQARLEAAPDTLPETERPPPLRPRRNVYLGWALAACLALVAVGELVWVQVVQTAQRQTEREAALVADFLSAPETQKISLYGRQREALGSVLTRPDGDALFVLGERPPAGQSYQAWGHTNDDWEPGSSDRLTSLKVSNGSVFEVETQNFAALYLSLEPPGGSPQPTYPISRVSLGEPVATSPLRITSPADGAVLEQPSVIVTGVVAPDITELSYSFNSEQRQTTTAAGSRFSFTLSLEPGVNTLSIRAAGPQGATTETLTLTRTR